MFAFLAGLISAIAAAAKAVAPIATLAGAGVGIYSALQKPKIPKIHIPQQPVKEIQAESHAARRNMEQRMRAAGMNRGKSRAGLPGLIEPIQTRRPSLKDTLG